MDQTGICNLALLRIGIVQAMTDVTTENSVTARACRTVYDICLSTMLRERPWPFAVRQVDLAQVSQQTRAEWFYDYRYPSGYLNVHRVIPTPVAATAPPVITAESVGLSPQTYPFSVGSDASGKLISSNIGPATALGTVLVTETQHFDPQFTSALAWFIASEIAMSLSKNRDLALMAMAEYQRVVSEAFATGANEPKPEASRDADMIEARQ